ncbi:MAG: acetylglutamate kinase [Acidobacteria bacterium]|nr:acetylglutamate kinase [Acidobacteriota bacterium]
MKLLIKIGGTLLESDETRRSLALQAANLAAEGRRTVLVHGGGKRLSRYLEQSGYKSEFRNGLRVTPPEILDAVLRVFAGSVNHHFVAELGAAGARAVGLSGIDAGLVQAVQLDPALGAVGRVEKVDPALLNLLTENGFTPVVACIAGGTDGGIYNVNADQMAAACGAGFEADELIFLTDVGGVLDGEGRALPRLTCDQAEALIASGVAHGGMEAKLRAAMSAVQTGAERVRIVSGAEPDILHRLLGGEDIGTILVNVP